MHDSHGKIPSSVARYEEKNLQSKDKIPHSITRHEEKDLESSFHPKGHLSETERLIKENLPMTVEVTTQPLRSTRPSDIPTAYLEVDTKVDLPSKGADFQPTEDPEPVEHFLKEPELVGGVLQDAEPVGHVAEGSQHPSTNNVPSGSDETTQSEISTTLHKIPSSYVAVNGKWDLPSKEPIGSSIESLRAETPSQVKSSENITIDQSFPPPKPSITSANASPEEASKTSQKIHNIQPQDHKIGINVNGAKLLSQLEVFLRETGTLRKEQKPIKFKDAVGRKFSFPFSALNP